MERVGSLSVAVSAEDLLDRLGREPGYDVLYDLGCIHGPSDAARIGAAAGLTRLARPGATLLIFRALFAGISGIGHKAAV